MGVAVEVVFFWLALSVAVGFYASSRGRSGVLWFFVGVVLTPLLAFVFCAVFDNKANPMPKPPSSDTHVKCPDCAELVLAQARVCKHCGCKLVPQ